jgi:MFS family permease
MLSSSHRGRVSNAKWGKRMIFKKAQKVYREYPGTFWTLLGATFIDRLGGALMFPFFALYVTQKFGVGMTQVGILFAIFAVSNVIGSMLGGALTDKLGRRWMIIFGLVMSALSSVAMGLINDLTVFYLLAAAVGLLADMGDPARQAMVADLLPEEKRAEGYGMFRVAFNFAVAVGPMLGGMLAAYNFLYLFIADAIASSITAAIVYLALPETKPKTIEGQPEQSLLNTLSGYGVVFRDTAYMAFLIVSLLATVVYIQMNSTLSVYLRDVHGVTPQQFGYILSLNAAMVVLFQFWITRRISKYAPMLMMAAGTALVGIGFVMYGLVVTFLMFIVAMIIITIGEMIIVPVAQALAAKFAPENMRGRYMAMFGFSWTLPVAIGPLLAGLIMDNYNPNWVWYAAGILAAVAVVGYLWLYVWLDDKVELADAEPLAAPPVYDNVST